MLCKDILYCRKMSLHVYVHAVHIQCYTDIEPVLLYKGLVGDRPLIGLCGCPLVRSSCKEVTTTPFDKGFRELLLGERSEPHTSESMRNCMSRVDLEELMHVEDRACMPTLHFLVIFSLPAAIR